MSEIKDALKKCDDLIAQLVEMKKALLRESAEEELCKAMPRGWSGKVVQHPQLGAMVTMGHGEHGTVTVHKNPNSGMFEVKHQGNYAGLKGKKGIFATPAEAMAHAQNYMSGLNSGTVAGRTLTNIPLNRDTPSRADFVRKPVAESIVPEASKLPLRKSWANHNVIPNADREIEKLLAKNPTQSGENALANQLANVMAGKAMLGNTPPKQPTDQEMFGHLVPSEEMVKSAEEGWNGAINNWLVEAAKPINSRFSSQEEEDAYWASIKVNGSSRDDYGF
jgi:hypothetical protein